MKRTAALALLATALLTPLLPLVVWAIGGRWRYPALVPQELSGRGLRLLADRAPRSCAVWLPRRQSGPLSRCSGS